MSIDSIDYEFKFELSNQFCRTVEYDPIAVDIVQELYLQDHPSEFSFDIPNPFKFDDQATATYTIVDEFGDQAHFPSGTEVTRSLVDSNADYFTMTVDTTTMNDLDYNQSLTFYIKAEGQVIGCGALENSLTSAISITINVHCLDLTKIYLDDTSWSSEVTITETSGTQFSLPLFYYSSPFRFLQIYPLHSYNF